MKSLLTRLCLQRTPGEVEFSLDKKDVISQLVSLGFALSNERAIESLENEEKELLDTVIDEGWAIHYNVYTNKYYFFRLFPSELLSRISELQERNINIILEDNLRKITAREFELFMKTFLTNIPGFYDVRITKATRDGGIDFSAKSRSENSLETVILGQAKHWKSPVGAPEVQKLVGILATNSNPHTPVRGIMVGLSGFTKPAEKAAWDSPYEIDCYSLADLLSLMRKYNIGIQHFSIDYLVPDSKLWEELHGQ